MAIDTDRDNGRHAVVAVIVEKCKFLVIRRSELVRAPGLLCFPGGGIELGESWESAIRREMLEELSLEVLIGPCLWTSVTRWGTTLEWILCARKPGSHPKAAPAEVAEVLWMTESELLDRSDLLGSLPDFFQALSVGEFRID